MSLFAKEVAFVNVTPMGIKVFPNRLPHMGSNLPGNDVGSIEAPDEQIYIDKNTNKLSQVKYPCSISVPVIVGDGQNGPTHGLIFLKKDELLVSPDPAGYVLERLQKSNSH